MLSPISPCRPEGDEILKRCRHILIQNGSWVAAQIRRWLTLELTPSRARRDPPSLRFVAAVVYMCERQQVGRDVGVAESGFRPTVMGFVRAATRSVRRWLVYVK